MPHTLTFFVKKPFWAYFIPELIYFAKCDDGIFVKCRTFTPITLNNFKKQWHFQCCSQYIHRGIQSIWKVRLRIKSSNKELSKCPMFYHHWANTLQDIAAAILIFCKNHWFSIWKYWYFTEINCFLSRNIDILQKSLVF